MRERIGSYRVERVLAEGGMGLVYLGRHETLGREAAIKTLLPKNAGDAALRQRLLREAQAQASLHHPNIVAVYDLIEEPVELFIAMEYVEGKTLAQLLDSSRGAMKHDEALPLFDQLLEALEYVHGQNIVHRDVKPSNVMVCGGRAKLADFGIALLSERPRLTASLQLIGSPPYMSPEQLQAKRVDHRSDIYSAALVLYRMLSGRAPFQAKEYLAQVHERVVGPPDLRTVMPALPAGVCAAIGIALRHDPEERFLSAAAFRAALNEGKAGFLTPSPLPAAIEVAVEDIPTEAIDVAPEPDSRTAAVLVAGVITVTFAGGLFMFVEQLDRRSLPENERAPSAVGANTIPPAPPTPQTTDAPVDPPRAVPARVTHKTEPFVEKRKAPEEDPEVKRRREVEALRDDISRGFTGVEAYLRAEQLDLAVEELDRVAAMAQLHPHDFPNERGEIARLRASVIETRVAAQTRIEEEARWASQLAGIEEDLREERWPEAERFANGIVTNPRAPGAIAARARTLLQEAKDGRRNAFKDMRLGPTTNTIRKPSSPPGNQP